MGYVVHKYSYPSRTDIEVNWDYTWNETTEKIDHGIELVGEGFGVVGKESMLFAKLS